MNSGDDLMVVNMMTYTNQFDYMSSEGNQSDEMGSQNDGI